MSLLCLRNAKEGGHSSWSSSITVYNEILRRRPDLAHLLAGPWFFDRKGEVPEGKKGFFEIPVFNFHVSLPAIPQMPTLVEHMASCASAFLCRFIKKTLQHGCRYIYLK